jgi:ABC-type multidrug transport system fused ATPase/permease subunit
MPKHLWAYIWKVSGRDQIWLSLLTVAVFLLTLAPLELQRRVINDAIGRRNLPSILLLCLAYVAVVLIQGGIKLWVNIYRARVSESATRHLRLQARQVSKGAVPTEPGQEGVQLSIIVSEVEPVGGFVGISFSEPLLHGGIMLSVFGYMLFLQPLMALVCLGVFLPQVFFVPLMQATINRCTKSKIKILREVSVDIVNNATTQPGAPPQSVAPQVNDSPRPNGDSDSAYVQHTDRIFQLDMHIFRLKFTMNFLMNSMQHLAIAAILFVGGWFVVQGRTEAGTVVAFISGLDRVNDPWGDLVNYFREMTSSRVKYHLVERALNGTSPIGDANASVAEIR